MKDKTVGAAVTRYSLCFALTLALATTPCLGLVELKNDDSFTLLIWLHDPFNPGFEVCLPVRVDEPFSVTWASKDAKNRVSGTLHDLAEGKYPLTLNIDEWASEGSNSRDTIELRLGLDKEYGWGVVQSIVYNRAVTLSKQGCRRPRA